MNKYLITFLLSLFACVFIYLISSFGAASFDINEWNPVGRIMSSFFMAFAVIFLIIHRHDHS